MNVLRAERPEEYPSALIGSVFWILDGYTTTRDAEESLQVRFVHH